MSALAEIRDPASWDALVGKKRFLPFSGARF